jgi:hypothetical protein
VFPSDGGLPGALPEEESKAEEGSHPASLTSPSPLLPHDGGGGAPPRRRASALLHGDDAGIDWDVVRRRVELLDTRCRLMRIRCGAGGADPAASHALGLLAALFQLDVPRAAGSPGGTPPCRVVSFTRTTDGVSLIVPEGCTLRGSRGDVESMSTVWMPLQVWEGRGGIRSVPAPATEARGLPWAHRTVCDAP